MTRRSLALLALLAAVPLGCRAHHLGPSTGDAYRGALAAQRASAAAPPAPADAADALRVLERHRGGVGRAAKPDATPLAIPGLGASLGAASTGAGAWSGATGTIQLDAK